MMECFDDVDQSVNAARGWRFLETGRRGAGHSFDGGREPLAGGVETAVDLFLRLTRFEPGGGDVGDQEQTRRLPARQNRENADAEISAVSERAFAKRMTLMAVRRSCS